MVRISPVLCRIRYARRQRDAYARKGIYKISQNLFGDRQAMRGQPIVDTQEWISPPEPEWNPPEGIPPDFRIPVPKNVTPETEQNPIWHLSTGISFTEGIDQACILTKTQRFDGLPPQVEKLVGKYSLEDQDHMIKDAILHSQVWDNTKQLLPKRIDLENIGWVFRREIGIPDSRSASILLNSFIRFGQSFGSRFPELATKRRILYKPSLKTSYEYKGETVQIVGINEYLVTGRRPLTPFGDQSLVEMSKQHNLPEMWPVYPTIDLLKITKYELENKGAFREVLEVPCSHPQIVFRLNAARMKPEKFQAYNLMLTFGMALTEARSRYGANSGALENPITIININNSFNVFNFLVFQLNTLDFDSKTGIKNFAWFDSRKLFEKHLCKQWKEPDRKMKPPTYDDYDSDVFKKFLALYLYDYAS